MRGKLCGFALVLGLFVNADAMAQNPPNQAAPPSYQLWEFGSMPRPAFKEVLLGTQAVRDELRLTAAQLKSMEDMANRESEKIQKLRLDIKDRKKFLEARDAISKETQAATMEILEPRQRERLDQIQLQSQGPVAFGRSWAAQLASEGPSMAQRLTLTDDQIKRAMQIAEEGDQEIGKAATLTVVLDTKAGAPTPESIRKFVESPEFKATKLKTRKAAREAWAAVIRRIEAVLTEPQRTAYGKMVGEPFDLWKIRFGDDETAEDVNLVTTALNGGGGGGGGGGQQADSTFDTKIARPAYPTRHPRVLFDEAHHNFHTTDGRYKPFAQVIANDGYQVIPNKEKFTRELLAKGDILIIANALGGEGIGAAGSSDSAFTEAECDSVRDWVKAGGSLLLITDHAPFGSAAEALARRFGVDMSKGFTSDPLNSEGGETFLVFSRKNNLLGEHPITKGRDDSERINKIQTFTGQSLRGPAGSVAILKLGENAVDDLDEGKTTPASGRAQGIAFTDGKGRVVVLGEAAELSAQVAGGQKFGMNVAGIDNRQMALNIMHWLSALLDPRENSQ